MVGEKLGSFRIEGTLGVGAMGVVYKAVHESTGKTAAVKVINKEIAQRGKTYERFKREADILQQFRHPNIVRFLALGRYQGTSYIAMEFIPGRTLEQVLYERGELPWQEVVELAIQICEALHYAHEHGVIHRDLKPSNLMITDDGRVKLTDFGIAKDLDKTALTATGRTLGTAAYMAPEQIRGTPEVSHKTDLYALGVVLYQMLTGQAPFEGTSAVVLMHCHMNEPVPRPSSKLAEIPRALDDLVVNLMAKAPADRPWDAAAVGEALKKIREKVGKGEAVPMVWPDGAVAPVPSRAAPKKKKAGKGPAAAGAAALEERARSFVRLETAALVIALVAMAAFVGYMLWPPSARYLYAQAERLMATNERHKWEEARTEYLDELDRLHPNHPYKATTRDWRDRIALAQVEGRATLLESPARTKLNEPQDKIEQRYAEYYKLVAAAQAGGDDREAVKIWEELSHLYKADEPDERPWHQLAAKRSEALAQVIARRREVVENSLAQADAAERAGRPRQAVTIRADLVRDYGRYTDVADLLGGNPPAEPVAPVPEPAPAPAQKPTATKPSATAPDTPAAPKPDPRDSGS